MVASKVYIGYNYLYLISRVDPAEDMVKGHNHDGAHRTYDSRGRRARAEETRQRILATGLEAFHERGYSGTTVALIASAASVSSEAVYKAFGNKAGLLRALHNAALEGQGPVPAEIRSDLLQKTESDPQSLIDGLGKLSAEVAPQVTPVLLLIRQAAAAGQTDMIELLHETETSRHERMLQVAGTLNRRGILRTGLGEEEAADLMWAYTSPGLYEDLVIKRGWTASHYGSFVARALTAALL